MKSLDLPRCRSDQHYGRLTRGQIDDEEVAGIGKLLGATGVEPYPLEHALDFEVVVLLRDVGLDGHGIGAHFRMRVMVAFRGLVGRHWLCHRDPPFSVRIVT